MTRLVTERPAAAAPRPFAFPAISSMEFPGVDLRAVHLAGRPRARLLVVADAGADAEGAGLEGVANLTADVMLRGADGRDAHALAIAFERVGAQPSTGVGYDTGQASLEAPAGVLAEAALLLAEVVRRPTLGARDVTETRDALVDEKHAALTRAEGVVARVARREVWAASSRYATSATGTETSLPALTPDDVRAFHAARWANNRLAVVVVGDLTGVDLDAIGQAFAASGEVAPSTVDLSSGPGGRIVLADRPEAAQSALLFQRVGEGVGAPDEAALEVALSASVASFSGRLNHRLREELGYTYGARGGVARRRHGGTFNASMSVRTEVTADAVRETIEVLRRTLEDGLRDDEVDQARDNVVRRYPVAFDANGSIASAVAGMWVHGLADGHHDRRLRELQDVTTDDANAALRRAIALDDLTIAVAGDASVVEADLATLGLGEVVRVTP